MAALRFEIERSGGLELIADDLEAGVVDGAGSWDEAEAERIAEVGIRAAQRANNRAGRHIFGDSGAGEADASRRTIGGLQRDGSRRVVDANEGAVEGECGVVGQAVERANDARRRHDGEDVA